MTPFTAALALALLAVLAGCTSAAATGVGAESGTGTQSGTGTDPGQATASYPASLPSAPPVPAAKSVPPTALAAIRRAVTRINNTAGGPVAVQRAVLEDLATSSEQAQAQRCPTATRTLEFTPAYSGLRVAPNGDVNEYLLPTYISIYTGQRITGSDLATLHWWMTRGQARTTALCVS